MSDRPAVPERASPVAAVATRGQLRLRRYFRCHGVGLELSMQDRRVMKVLDPLVDGLPLQRESLADAPIDLTLEVVSVDQPYGLPKSGRLDRAYGLSIRQTADTCWAGDGHSAFRTEFDTGHGQLLLHESFTEHSLSHRRNLFLLALMQLLAGRGVYDLHGAAVVNEDQACLLLAGPGAGKSTATTALVKAGWHYVSDDAVLLRKDGSGVEALCFRQQISLTPSLRRWFPELGQSVGSADDDVKAFLDPELIYGRCHRMRCRPTRLLLLSRTEGRSRSRLSPAGAQDAMAALIGQTQSLSFSRSNASTQLALLAALVHQTDAYHIELGTDVLEAPETLSASLSALPKPRRQPPRNRRSPQTAVSL